MFCWWKFIFSTVTAPAGPRSDRLSGTIRKLGLESCKRVLGDVRGALWRASGSVANSAWTVRGAFPVPGFTGFHALNQARRSLKIIPGCGKIARFPP